MPAVCAPSSPEPVPAMAEPPTLPGEGGGAASTGDFVAAPSGAGDDAAVAGAAPSGADHGVPWSLLRRIREPPASPRTRERSSLLQLVVVPRSQTLQASEEALALDAMVIGTRPAVTTAMVRDHLREGFGLVDDLFSVARHWPDDFIVRFSRREDLELVLGTPQPDDAPFALRWRR